MQLRVGSAVTFNYVTGDGTDRDNSDQPGDDNGDGDDDDDDDDDGASEWR